MFSFSPLPPGVPREGPDCRFPSEVGGLGRIPGGGGGEFGLNWGSETYPYPRGWAGPEIVDFWGLNGPLLPQNPLEKVGGEAPHFFQWVLLHEGAF